MVRLIRISKRSEFGVEQTGRQRSSAASLDSSKIELLSDHFLVTVIKMYDLSTQTFYFKLLQTVVAVATRFQGRKVRIFCLI